MRTSILIYRTSVLLGLAFSLGGCGTTETATSNVSGGSLVSSNQVVSGSPNPILQPNNPLFVSYDRSLTNPDQLITENRQLPLNEFMGLTTPDLSTDQTQDLSVVTGIGLDAVDPLDTSSPKKPLTIALGIVARQFNSTTKTFSASTRVFSAAGTTFENAQTFVISNSNNANILLTGLGIKLQTAELTNFAVQRTPLANLMTGSFSSMQTGTSVTLDPGWAAIGFIIRISKGAKSTQIPFISDAILYTGALITQTSPI